MVFIMPYTQQSIMLASAVALLRKKKPIIASLCHQRCAGVSQKTKDALLPAQTVLYVVYTISL